MKITYCTQCRPSKVVAMGPALPNQKHKENGVVHGDLKSLEVKTQIFMPRTETLQDFMDQQTLLHGAKLV